MMFTETPKDPRIETDPDFIALPRYQNSLRVLCARYPNGVPTKIAALSLQITEEEFEEEFLQIVTKLRKAMDVK